MSSPWAAVTTEWRDGNLYYLDKNHAVIFYIDGVNRAVVFPSGAGLSGAITVDAADLAAGSVLASKLGLEVINKSGSDIGVDKVVAIVGLDTTSGKPKIVLADADVAAHDTLYVTSAAIANNAAGVVVKSALSAANLATDGVTTAGDPVYLDVTAGGFVATAPTGATARVHPVGFAVVKDATVGQILWLCGPVRSIGRNEIQAAAVSAAKQPLFVSTEQTGTGSSQNVAHGLGATPTKVLIVPTEHPGTPDTGAFDIAEGSHDGTNVVVTVTVNVKFKVWALV